MMFWRKKPASVQSDKGNPYRVLNPAAFDRGAKINQRARELQRVAVEGLSEADALTALGTALGNEVAAMAKRQPNFAIDEILELACGGVHEAAYIAADLPPKNFDRELTSDEFTALSSKLLNIAVANKILPMDGIGVTAKALGTLISFAARRQGCSTDELLTTCKEAVSTYAYSATDYMLEHPDADPAERK